jgi:hypothetical protein
VSAGLAVIGLFLAMLVPNALVIWGAGRRK